jgi:hypothetical protein
MGSNNIFISSIRYLNVHLLPVLFRIMALGNKIYNAIWNYFGEGGRNTVIDNLRILKLYSMNNILKAQSSYLFGMRGMFQASFCFI